ncbi:hypothetical protein, partial [Arenibacterium sp. S380]|uniref:hypothetical protein n=1 Tax=Arenibacterium sp. S380 TaxID=3415138 RepID=UPI003C7A6CE0
MTNNTFGGQAEVSRRTIVKGASWTIPAIAIAATVPGAAASSALALNFDKTAYIGDPCAAITANIVATMNGQAIAGQTVTVQLAGGYTFQGGSAIYTGVTGADGSLQNMPAIVSPIIGGSGTITASSGTAQAGSATISNAPAPQTPSRILNDAVTDTYSFIPANAVAVGYNFYLTPSGDLYNVNKTTGPVASGVTSLGSVSGAGSDYGSAMINGVASRILNGD